MVNIFRVAHNSVIGSVSRHLDKGLKPRFILLNVTSRCNSKCIMCNVWKKNTSEDISADRLISLFKNNKDFFKNLEEISLMGGEPFLLRELPDVLSAACEVSGKLVSITIPTNGLATTLIIEQARETLEKLRDNITLNVGVSIDGIEEVHDNIRGVKGAYKRTINTLTKLKTLQKQHPNLSVGFGTVILPQNIHQITQLKDLAKTMNVKCSFNPLVQTENLYENTGLSLPHLEKKDVLSIFNNHDSSGEGFKNYCVSEIIEHSHRPLPCPWGFSFMYLDSNGDVYPCHYLPKKYLLGNIKDQNIQHIWFSQKANHARKMLKTEKYCKSCTSTCGFYENIKVSIWSYGVYRLKLGLSFL